MLFVFVKHGLATASQLSPDIVNYQVKVRCDRRTGDNKGGAMICVPIHMQPCQTHSFIEEACSNFTLPNDHMQVL